MLQTKFPNDSRGSTHKAIFHDRILVWKRSLKKRRPGPPSPWTFELRDTPGKRLTRESNCIVAMHEFLTNLRVIPDGQCYCLDDHTTFYDSIQLKSHQIGKIFRMEELGKQNKKKKFQDSH
jgi:hypothetical protein